MPHVGTAELIIILAIALIVFGPKKLPEIGKSIGQGLRELRKASRDIMDSVDLSDDSEPEWKNRPADTVPSFPAPSVENELENPELSEPPVQQEKEKSDNATSSNDSK